MNDRAFLELIDRNPIVLTSDGIRRCLNGAGAFWIYEGKPCWSKPHAKLFSGLCSNGYVNVGSVLKAYPGVRRAFAMSIVMALQELWDGVFTCVTGADTSTTLLAQDVAEIAGVKHIRMQKHEDGEGKKQVWHPDNKLLVEGDVIFHIEELVTTAASALLVHEGIRRHNSDSKISFVPYLITVVDRSNPDSRVAEVDGLKVKHLLQLNIRNFHPNGCPYCAVGSEAIGPKEGENWHKLAGK